MGDSQSGWSWTTMPDNIAFEPDDGGRAVSQGEGGEGGSVGNLGKQIRVCNWLG